MISSGGLIESLNNHQNFGQRAPRLWVFFGSFLSGTKVGPKALVEGFGPPRRGGPKKNEGGQKSLINKKFGQPRQNLHWSEVWKPPQTRLRACSRRSSQGPLRGPFVGPFETPLGSGSLRSPLGICTPSRPLWGPFGVPYGSRTLSCITCPLATSIARNIYMWYIYMWILSLIIIFIIYSSAPVNNHSLRWRAVVE